jgi:hypothetical protein
MIFLPGGEFFPTPPCGPPLPLLLDYFVQNFIFQLLYFWRLVLLPKAKFLSNDSIDIFLNSRKKLEPGSLLPSLSLWYFVPTKKEEERRWLGELEAALGRSEDMGAKANE